MFDGAFNLHAVLTSTGGAALCTVVSGPIAQEIGMNARGNLLGPGNRANASIGRALRLVAMNVLGAKPADCLLVGDTPSDMEAGRRAGIRTCAVTWGYGDPHELAHWAPDFWIDAPHQLLPDF